MALKCSGESQLLVYQFSIFSILYVVPTPITNFQQTPQSSSNVLGLRVVFRTASLAAVVYPAGWLIRLRSGLSSEIAANNQIQAEQIRSDNEVRLRMFALAAIVRKHLEIGP